MNLIKEMFSENLEQLWDYYILNGNYNIKQVEGSIWLA
jgi:hypothetical protein